MKVIETHRYGKDYAYYFSDNATTDQIVEYLQVHINELMLHDAVSCVCEKVDENNILITGDEDYQIITIYNIIPLL